jgi:hypothetical protein
VLSFPPGSGVFGAFVVEGDLVISDESALRTHYDRFYANAPLDAAVTPFDAAWTGDQKRNLKYCIERTTFAAVDYDNVSEAAWMAAGAWEQIADVRFVNDIFSADNTCSQPGADYQLRIRRVFGAPYTIVYAPNMGGGKFLLVGDAAVARPKHELHAVFRHALGHVLGLGHARTARFSSCTSTSCSDLDRLARWSSMRPNWCAEPIPDLLYPNQADAMPLVTAYDDPGSVLRAGTDVYARGLSTREVFRFGNASWAKVGDATRSLAEVNGSLYRLTGNGEQIQVLQSPGDAWQPIGGPVNNILRCGAFLCAIDATDGALVRYSNGTWQRLGEPSRGYASTDTEVFRATADNQFVERYDEQSKAWVQIGGSAGYLHAGPQFLYVTAPSSAMATVGTVMRWRPELANWLQVGGSGRLFVSTLDGLWGVTPAWERLFLLTDEVAQNWTHIDGESMRIEGRQELFALNFDGTIRRYRSGVWVNLGQPQ